MSALEPCPRTRSMLILNINQHLMDTNPAVLAFHGILYNKGYSMIQTALHSLMGM